MSHRHADRGFTFIELMTTFAIAGILLGIGGWQVTSIVPAYRAKNAARKLLLDVRGAQSIAVRTNQPVTLALDCDGSDAGYTITGKVWDDGAAAFVDTNYETVRFDGDFRGVAVTTAGATGSVSCADDGAALALDAGAGSTFCGGALTFLPSGQVLLPDGGTSETIALAPEGDLAPDRVMVIGIQAPLGRSRVYTTDDGATWDCK